MTPRSVGLVGPLPPPSGGMANQTKQLARLLSEEGMRVQVVQVNRDYRPRWIGSVKGVRAIARLLPYLVALWRATGRVDLVHVMANSGWSWYLFAAPAIWIARLRRRPVIVNYRGGEADAFFSRSFKRVRTTLNKASAIVVPSAFLHSVFERWGYCAVVVPNIIDLSRFRAAEKRPDGNQVQSLHIVVTRNLEPIYDIPTALRVLARVRSRWPDARMTVAGSGPESARLAQLAQDLGIAEAVTFAGRVDNEHMAELYQRADIMLNTSLADNMPISFLEALASGVPIVSTDVGGIPYLVRDGEQALLAPAADDEALAARVEQLWLDPQLRGRLQRTGLELVGQFEWTRVRGALLKAYADVLSHPDGLVSHQRRA